MCIALLTCLLVYQVWIYLSTSGWTGWAVPRNFRTAVITLQLWVQRMFCFFQHVALEVATSTLWYPGLGILTNPAAYVCGDK